MRILAGEYKGRTLAQPKSTATRPMTEKARAAIFDVIGDVWQADVIDAYAGSGAVGLEALSRGARSVWAIEMNREGIRAIKKNLAACGFEDEGGGVYLGKGGIGYDLTARPVASAIKEGPGEKHGCHLIVADPPYDKIDSAELSKLGQFLDDNGIMVVSHTSKISPPELKSLELAQTKRYGDSTLSYYKK